MDSQSDVIKQIQQRGNCEYMGAPLYNSFNFFLKFQHFRNKMLEKKFQQIRSSPGRNSKKKM